MNNVTRREFLVDSAVLAGGAIGTLTLGSGLLFPQTGHAAKEEFPESSCGVEKGINHKVLVAYASRCGSTGEVAEAIGQVFCDSGAAVDIRLVESVSDLTSYRAIVIGSAIHSSKWLPEAIKFVETNRKVLSQMPVAYFLTCLTLSKPTEENHHKARAFLDPLRNAVPQVQPVDTGLFAGVLDYSKLSLIVRVVMKSKMKGKGVSEGDYRDWDAIRSWAKGLRSALFGV